VFEVLHTFGHEVGVESDTVKRKRDAAADFPLSASDPAEEGFIHDAACVHDQISRFNQLNRLR
jgi:hypothetical protein